MSALALYGCAAAGPPTIGRDRFDYVSALSDSWKRQMLLNLAGDEFAKSRMAPIPVTSLLFLIQSGHPADAVLRVVVNSINGFDNAYGGPGNPRCQELMNAMRESQAAGDTGFRIREAKDKQDIVMFIRTTADKAAPGGRIR